MSNYAITGATGGLGRELSFKLAKENANLIFLDRNLAKSEKLRDEIKTLYPDINIEIIIVDLENINSVKTATEVLKKKQFDTLILNAGVYNIPIKKTSTGYNNIFQINFISHYYIVKQLLDENVGLKKVIAISSIAHNYSKLDTKDIDFSHHTKSSKIYGNSKRFLTFSLFELFKNRNDIDLCIAHPGITLTNMTNHYPKAINWLVKIAIKVLFPSPKKAVSSIISATKEKCGYFEWIGPRLFNIWGNPKKKKLKTCSELESKNIFKIAENIYKSLK